MRALTIEPDNLLSPLVTVHCFWYPRCKHVVTDTPMAAHDAMEKHYHERHQEDIRRIVGWALAKTEYRRRLASKVTEVQP